MGKRIKGKGIKKSLEKERWPLCLCGALALSQDFVAKAQQQIKGVVLMQPQG